MSAAGAVGESFRRHWDWRTRESMLVDVNAAAAAAVGAPA